MSARPLAKPSPEPLFTVVVPVHDGGDAFTHCLAALGRSRFQDWEMIVVDDGSGDRSAQMAREAGADVLRTDGPHGPAAARNLGASRARGAWIFFLDSDCAIHPDALERAAGVVAEAGPDLDALFGSYDDDPAAPDAVSRYRNLLHHHVHHRGHAEASTFWAGCGAVRRVAFEAVGGFNARRYSRPSIEDIDLGVRLRARGGRIRLVPEIQAKHLKRWTIGGMVRTDALARAAPWTELALRSGGFPRDLNTGLRGRLGMAFSIGSMACLAASPWRPGFLALAAIFGALTVTLDFDLFRLLRQRGGISLALAGVPLHFLHHLAAAAGFTIGLARNARRRLSASRR